MKKTLGYLCVSLIIFSPLRIKAQDLETISKQKPVSLNGYLDIKTIIYNANGIPERRKPFSFFITGAPTLNLYGVAIPFNFTISEQERSFRQPFNQFGLSPQYKWATAHLGYRNLNFSPYTLAGHTMLGAGFELTPGIFKVGFMYGRLNRATLIDTTTGVTQPYSFSDKGMAFKFGVGKEKHNVELSVLRAKSDTNSLYKKLDPGKVVSVLPTANLVGSILTHHQLGKQLSFDGEIGYSVFTRNIGATLTVPDSIQKLNSLFGSIIPINASSEDYWAYAASLNWKEKNYSIKLGYRRVDPSFQSMGAYFFNNDLENITISPSFNTKDNMFRFSGSIGFQHDNLKKQKQFTTKRVIGSANISWNINTRLGLDANFMNFSSNSTPQVTLVNNIYKLTNTTSTISITPRYMYSTSKKTHVVLLSYNYSTLADANTSTKTVNNIQTQVALLTYTLSFIPQYLSVNTGVNYTSNKLVTGTNSYYGASVGASKSFLKDHSLIVSTQNAYNFNTVKTSANVLNLSLSGSYQAAKKHRFYMRWNLINTTVNGGTGFTENTGELGYTFSF